jgi:hypothetical protein
LQFFEPLDDYLRVVNSIKSAVQQRIDKKSIYLSSLVDVEAKSNAYRKLSGVAGKETQANVKEEAVKVAQEHSDLAKAKFEKVTERLLNEFESFKVNKAMDLKKCMIDYIELQVCYFENFILSGNILPHMIEANNSDRLQSKM